MTAPFDIENALDVCARARATTDQIMVETARLAGMIADGFRGDFDATLDMETVGQALLVAAASVTRLAADEVGMPATVIVNMIGLAGENLVRTARARAAEAREVEGVLCEHVLTWHPVDATEPPTELRFFEHIEFLGHLGEFRSHSREVPPPAELMKGVEPGAPYANATSLPDCGNADPKRYCVRPAGHDGDHFDRDGRFFGRVVVEIPESALEYAPTVTVELPADEAPEVPGA